MTSTKDRSRLNAKCRRYDEALIHTVEKQTTLFTKKCVAFLDAVIEEFGLSPQYYPSVYAHLKIKRGQFDGKDDNVMAAFELGVVYFYLIDKLVEADRNLLFALDLLLEETVGICYHPEESHA